MQVRIKWASVQRRFSGSCKLELPTVYATSRTQNICDCCSACLPAINNTCRILKKQSETLRIHYFFKLSNCEIKAARNMSLTRSLLAASTTSLLYSAAVQSITRTTYKTHASVYHTREAGSEAGVSHFLASILNPEYSTISKLWKISKISTKYPNYGRKIASCIKHHSDLRKLLLIMVL